MKLFRSTAIVSSMTLLSRVLGFLRDAIVAQRFGASAATDAFFVAFRIPNFLRRLFAEGSFSLAFVPVLAEYKARGDVEALRELNDRVAGTLGAILLVVTAIGVLAAPALVALFAPGYLDRPEQFAMTADMLRITFPYILLISLAGFAGGILNSHGRFAMPALSPVLLNLAMISFAVLGASYFQPPIAALAWGVLCGGLLQLGMQLPGLARLGLLPRPRWGWGHEGVRKILRLMIPTLFGASVAQVNLLVDTLIASFLIAGSVSWLYYAERLLEFPLGVFGVALSTVILPSLSAHHSESKPEAFSAALDWAMRVGCFIALPAALSLLILAEPLMWTLFGYRQFAADDVHMAGLALAALSLGLPAFILIKVIAPGFYSRQDTRTPVKAGIIAMLANVVFNAIIVGTMVYRDYPAPHMGMALASALAGWLNFALLFRWLRASGAFVARPGWIRFALQLALAGSLLAAWLWWASVHWLAFADESVLERLIGIALLIGVGGVVYVGSLLLSGLRPRDLLDRPVAG
ncbi:MAG: murein biosynthesis integral membrane protein MurJ [Xanthomonadales bacterium]|nr:murein biosynthesis integral membrane protein MurJ [Xanthomonadales bacterium]